MGPSGDSGIIGDVGEKGKTGPRGLDGYKPLLVQDYSKCYWLPSNNVDYRYLPKNKGTGNIIQKFKVLGNRYECMEHCSRNNKCKLITFDINDDDDYTCKLHNSHSFVADGDSSDQIRYILVQSGSPNLSVSKDKCQEYSMQNNKNYNGNYNSASYPTGCFIINNNVYYNNTSTNVNCGVSNSKCIHKDTGTDKYSINNDKLPDMSVLKNQCEDYAKKRGIAYNGNYNNTYQPSGCIEYNGKIYYNNKITNELCGIPKKNKDALQAAKDAGIKGNELKKLEDAAKQDEKIDGAKKALDDAKKNNASKEAIKRLENDLENEKKTNL